MPSSLNDIRQRNFKIKNIVLCQDLVWSLWPLTCLVWWVLLAWGVVAHLFWKACVAAGVHVGQHVDGAAAVTLFDHVVALFDGCFSGIGVEFLMFEAGYSVLACWIGGVVLSLVWGSVVALVAGIDAWLGLVSYPPFWARDVLWSW